MRAGESWENEEYRCQLCMQLFASDVAHARTPLLVCENVHNFCAKCCGPHLCLIRCARVYLAIASLQYACDTPNMHRDHSQTSSTRATSGAARSAAPRSGPTPSPTAASSTCSPSSRSRAGRARARACCRAPRRSSTRSSAPTATYGARCTQVPAFEHLWYTCTC